ncbi:hypothetical protein [Lysobacter sp. Root494]|uniref:hypothetical protein n=1 Tax=Lysobacter sp. Root494 TaxID=1736549 RepID=UPI0006FBFFF6|nr:hypothetical protein [Lysobacter sp. Root494]KQY51145.1 hypothetical protein ASD14_10035 [Lysobacter sp. Root494]
MAATALPALLPYAFTAGIGWMYYRRIRRQFGRQPWQPRRTVVRIGLLSLVLVSLVLAGIFVPHAAWAVTAGFVVGLGLGFYGVSLTSVDLVDGQRSYLPNPWIGGALSLLLIARLAWRFLHGGFMQSQAATGASPLTLGFAAALIGYYLTYSIVLVLRMRRLAPRQA